MSEFSQVVKDGFSKVVDIIKRFFLIILLIVAVGTAGYVWVMGWTYSEGTRAGTLIKVSNKGVVFKTNEGQLNMGGFQPDAQSGIIGNIWDFSVIKSSVYKDLQQAEGKQVKLYYRQRYKAMPWQGKTEYFVYKVEMLE